MDLFYTLLSFIAFSLLGIFLVFCFIMLTTILGKSIGDPDYAPVKGTVFNQLFYFNTLHDYQAEMAKTIPTFRLLAPDQSEVYTADPRNIEHILKTNFDKYSKGKYNQDIVTDLFGEGIFAVDGDKWRQQRKLASYEFSTRVLRDFSYSVFRRNAAKLVRIISELSHQGQVFDMQKVKDSWRVVNHRDIIPTVPRLMGYCHVERPVFLAAGVLRNALENKDILGDGYEGDVLGESTPDVIVSEFLKGEKELIEKLLQTEINIFRSIRDGSALMQHMEDFYYITLLENVRSNYQAVPRSEQDQNYSL